MNEPSFPCETFNSFKQVGNLRRHQARERAAVPSLHGELQPQNKKSPFDSIHQAALGENEVDSGLNTTMPATHRLTLSFPAKKRRSIFDGLDVTSLKRRKLDMYNGNKDSSDEEKESPHPLKARSQSLLLKFRCKVCGRDFPTLFGHKTHMESEHNSAEDNEDAAETAIPSKDKEIGVNAVAVRSPKAQGSDEKGSFVINETSEQIFSSKLRNKLLESLPEHFSVSAGYLKLDTRLPVVKPRCRVKLGEGEFTVGELKGEGGFAKVFSATWNNGPKTEMDSVLKIQKPANDWEWYILREVEIRVSQNRGRGFVDPASFMSSQKCVSFRDGSIIVSQHQRFGTLLDLVNVSRAGTDKSCVEPIAVNLAAEILGIVDSLHSVDIIHADIKPDNFMMKNILGNSPLQLIDFGKSIDLRVLPPYTAFTEPVETSGLVTIEMREGRPWRHHIDYFGVAATVYCLLFGRYMEVFQSRGRWAPMGSYKRWWKVGLWKKFFDEFLNLEGMELGRLPSMQEWRKQFLDLFREEKMSESYNRAKHILLKTNVSNRRRTL